MQYINNQDWAMLGKEFRAASPFPSICIDNFLDSKFAKEVSNSYPDYSKAQKQGNEFRTVNEKCKVQITDPNKFPEPVNSLHSALAAKEFISSMETLSGIANLSFDNQFSGGGMHITNHSGILDVHVDFNYSERLEQYRRLNLLIYLNEGWQNNWGGKVELWDKNVKHCVHSFSPVQNRCIIFATSDYSYHGVTAVSTPTNHSRKSFAIYLYNHEPNSMLHGENHGTVFKARPDEKFKKYCSMPAEYARRQLTATYQQGKNFFKKML